MMAQSRTLGLRLQLPPDVAAVLVATWLFTKRHVEERVEDFVTSSYVTSHSQHWYVQCV